MFFTYFASLLTFHSKTYCIFILAKNKIEYRIFDI